MIHYYCTHAYRNYVLCTPVLAWHDRRFVGPAMAATRGVQKLRKRERLLYFSILFKSNRVYDQNCCRFIEKERVTKK